MSTIIKIDLLVELNNLLDLLKQNEEQLNTMLPNLLGITEQWWHFVNLEFQ